MIQNADWDQRHFPLIYAVVMDYRRKKVIAAKTTFFIGLVILALTVTRLVACLNFPSWAEIFIVFLTTKVLYDIVFALLSKDKKYLFFEDYFRETLVFIVVTAICVAGITVVEMYIGGKIWVPLLAAGYIFVWR